MLSRHGKQWKLKNTADGNQDSIFHQVTNAEGGRTDINVEDSHEEEAEPEEEQEAAEHGAIGKTPSQRSARANQEAEAADEAVEAAEEEAEADRVHLRAKTVGLPSGHREAPVEARRIAAPAQEDSGARARARIVRRRQRGSMP